MVHPARQLEPAAARGEVEQRALLDGVRGDRLEHLLGEPLAAARIVAALAAAVGDELGGDVDVDGGVERDDLVVEGGEVAVLERREPA